MYISQYSKELLQNFDEFLRILTNSYKFLRILTNSYEFLHILVYRSAVSAKRPSAPAKRLRTLAAPPIPSQIDDDDIEVQDTTSQVITPTSASPEDLRTACGRPSVVANLIRVKYPPSYRGSLNPGKVFDVHLVLGKCIGLVGVNMIGYKFSTNEEKDHHFSMLIFESAAQICLDPGDLEEISSFPPVLVRQFIKNMCISQHKSLFVDLFAVARGYFQDQVFAPVRRIPEHQMHLGLDMSKSVVDL